MIINLFIGVITASMNEAKEELGNAEQEVKTVETDEDFEDQKLQDYMRSRLVQIKEIVHTIFEEFQELAVQEKERVSDVEIFLRSNRNSHLQDSEISRVYSSFGADSSEETGISKTKRRGSHNRVKPLGAAVVQHD